MSNDREGVPWNKLGKFIDRSMEDAQSLLKGAFPDAGVALLAIVIRRSDELGGERATQYALHRGEPGIGCSADHPPDADRLGGRGSEHDNNNHERLDQLSPLDAAIRPFLQEQFGELARLVEQAGNGEVQAVSIQLHVRNVGGHLTTCNCEYTCYDHSLWYKTSACNWYDTGSAC